MEYHVERVIIDGPDPAELLLKAAHQLTAQTRLLMTVLDHLYNAGEIEAFQTLVLDAIGEVAPEVRQKIEDNLVRRHPIRGAL